LYIGVAAAEQVAGAIARDGLDLVGEFLAAVIAPPGIAFGILVGQHRTQRRQHFGIGVVLRRDHLDAVDLAALFAGNGGVDGGIEGVQRAAVRIHGRLRLQKRTDASIGSPGDRRIVRRAPRW
jgi:hypothetical protein